MKKLSFTKPSVEFPSFPIIFNWIEAAYKKVETYDDFVAFIQGCMTEAENTKNEIKRKAYTQIANALYSSDTNTSYESKNIQILVDSL